MSLWFAKEAHIPLNTMPPASQYPRKSFTAKKMNFVMVNRVLRHATPHAAVLTSRKPTCTRANAGSSRAHWFLVFLRIFAILYTLLTVDGSGPSNVTIWSKHCSKSICSQLQMRRRYCVNHWLRLDARYCPEKAVEFVAATPYPPLTGLYIESVPTEVC